MKTGIKILFLLVAIYINACKNADKDNVSEVIPIDITSARPHSCLDYFEVDQVIPLETNDSAMVGNITCAIIENGTIYLSSFLEPSVQLFSLSGDFIMQIGQEGRGPGELLMVSDMSIFNKVLVLYDNRLKRALFYQDNGFIFQKQIPFGANALLFLDSTTFLTFHPAAAGATTANIENKATHYQLRLFENNKHLKSYLPIHESFLGVIYKTPGASRNFIKNREHVYLFDVLNSTIYKISENAQPIPFFKFDFGSYSLNANKSTDDVHGLIEKAKSSQNGKAYLYSAFIRDRFIYIHFGLKNNKYTENNFMDAIPYDAIYDRQTREVFVSRRDEQPLFFGIEEAIFLGFQGDYQGAVVSLPALPLVKQYNKHPESLPPKLRQVAKNLRITDNDVLVMMKYKNEITNLL